MLHVIKSRCTIESSNQFWLHYLSLERSLNDISEYIAINADNYSCYSFKVQRSFFSICSEIDSIYKHIHMHIYSKNINDVKGLSHNTNMAMLRNNFPSIQDTVVTLNISGDSIDIKPFRLLFYAYEIDQVKKSERKITSINVKSDYDKFGSWWKHYNDLKHQRRENFFKANIYNLVNSLSALHILNLLYAVIKDNLANCYDTILIQANSLNRFPILQVKNGGLIIYASSLVYGCHLNNQPIYDY